MMVPPRPLVYRRSLRLTSCIVQISIIRRPLHDTFFYFATSVNGITQCFIEVATATIVPNFVFPLADLKTVIIFEDIWLTSDSKTDFQ